MDPIVVVGGGIAAASATETLRAEGYDGDLVVVTAEGLAPYQRPPLSKGYLRGEAGREEIFPLDPSWYADHDVDLRTSTSATSVAVADRAVELSSGDTLRWSRLLLATGARVRRLAVPGAGLGGVHHLRTVAESDELSAALHEDGPVVVVGDGWIAMEVAASARQLGRDVTVVGRSAYPLRTLGAEVAAIYAEVHLARGTRLVRGRTVTALHGEDTVAGVELDDGTLLEARTVVVGIGVEPDVRLGAAAGLAQREASDGGGLAVDGSLRTSAPDVWAAGDVASVPSPRYGSPLRFEHWATAQETGRHAARAMLGARDDYDVLPYFYSDQYEVGMEAKGITTGAVVLSGSVATRELVAFWLADDGRVNAGMGINVWDRMDEVEDLIRADSSPGPETLRRFLD